MLNQHPQTLLLEPCKTKLALLKIRPLITQLLPAIIMLAAAQSTTCVGSPHPTTFPVIMTSLAVRVTDDPQKPVLVVMLMVCGPVPAPLTCVTAQAKVPAELSFAVLLTTNVAAFDSRVKNSKQMK